MVFEVSNGKSKLFLAGTIHVLRDEDLPPPEEFAVAYSQAQKMIFETDLNKAKSPEFAQRLMQSMVLPNNQSLSDILQPKHWAALQAYAEQNQFPLEQVEKINPVMISLLITMGELKKLNVGDGVDAFYYKAAKTDRKMIGELETSEDVIEAFRAFAEEDPNKLIESSLTEVTELKSILAVTIDEWKRGNLAALDKSLGEKMRQETPKGYAAMVVVRNKKWLPQIKEMLTTPEIEMVLVGSLHLSGKDGLIASLKKAGYQVKPYEPK